jgi:malate dehydrogenase (oxaloacetate-decarboxylating)
MVDLKGIICDGDEFTNPSHYEMAKLTNKNKKKGGLAEALKGADAFIGVSKPNLVSQDMVRSMAEKPIIFAMANPTPEIMPDLAKEAGAFIVGTGRSDFPNQINNVVAFPGIFKGALSVRAKDINEEMKRAAAYAIAGSVTPEKLNADYILPDSFDKSVAQAVATAVADAAVKSGVARIK